MSQKPARTLVVIPLLLLAIVAIGYLYFIDRQKVRTPLAFSSKNALTQQAGDFTSAGSYMIQVSSLSHHSASAVMLDDGSLLLAWFAGSREGAADVAIYTSRIVTPTRISAPRIAVTRQALSMALKRHYAKLGNPVLARLSDGRLVMYLTVVSIGGWSVSSIAVLTSEDNGASWQAQRELQASPFFNISTLVKYTPILGTTADNKQLFVLPAYHESFAKYGQYLLLDKQWRTKEVVRLGKLAIQPSQITHNDALYVVMRDKTKQPTQRHIQHWRINSALWAQAQTPITLPNPDAGVDIVALDNAIWLMAYNDSQTNRHNLSLAYSADAGDSWHLLETLEKQAGFEFSYPHFVTNGHFIHLFYTYNRQAIKHLWWSADTIKQRIENKK